MSDAPMAAPDLLEELERLRGWKDSAMRLLSEWDRVHEALGSPGQLGESKAAASLAKARALLAASGTGERPGDDRAMTWAEALTCTRCYDSLDVPGALLFSPPMADGTVRKLHICARCFYAAEGYGPVPTPPDAGTGTPSDDGRHRSITAIQDAITAHAEKAWPNLTVEVEGLALMEEALELFEVLAKHLAAIARSLVKRHHGNRGTNDDWTAELRKEMADTVLVLCNLAHLEHFDLGLVVNERLDVVLARSVDHDPVAPAAPSGTTGATTRDES